MHDFEAEIAGWKIWHDGICSRFARAEQGEHILYPCAAIFAAAGRLHNLMNAKLDWLDDWWQSHLRETPTRARH